jgi:hypothetical protein
MSLEIAPHRIPTKSATAPMSDKITDTIVRVVVNP